MAALIQWQVGKVLTPSVHNHSTALPSTPVLQDALPPPTSLARWEVKQLQCDLQL